MHPFETYLHEHNLDPIRLSVVAKVRYLTVWNAMKGNPIHLKDAETLRRAAFHLTGVAYKGIFAISTSDVPVEQQPTLPLGRLRLEK